MAIFINNSDIGFNGALPGRTIETDDQNYIDVLLERGFEQIAESEEATDKKPKTKKIQTETEPQNPPAEPPAGEPTGEQNPPAGEPPADETTK